MSGYAVAATLPAAAVAAAVATCGAVVLAVGGAVVARGAPPPAVAVAIGVGGPAGHSRRGVAVGGITCGDGVGGYSRGSRRGDRRAGNGANVAGAGVAAVATAGVFATTVVPAAAAAAAVFPTAAVAPAPAITAAVSAAIPTSNDRRRVGGAGRAPGGRRRCHRRRHWCPVAGVPAVGGGLHSLRGTRYAAASAGVRWGLLPPRRRSQ